MLKNTESPIGLLPRMKEYWSFIYGVTGSSAFSSNLLIFERIPLKYLTYENALLRIILECDLNSLKFKFWNRHFLPNFESAIYVFFLTAKLEELKILKV